VNQLLSFAGFELRYHLRRPLTYVFMATMFFFAFLFGTTDVIRIGGVGGKIALNSPWALSTVIMILTLVGMIVTPAISGTAVLRDFELKTHELLFTTRLSKPSFVLGRFLGAYLVSVLVYSCAALGIAAAMLWPWLDPEKLGPGGLANYLWPLVVYVLPNTLIACALFFAVGILTRSFVAVAVQGVVLFVGYSTAQSLLSDLENKHLAALLDPFGLNATRALQESWTVVEKNTLLTPLQGLLLENRLLWIGVALLVLGLAYRMFRMEAFLGGRRKRQKPAAPEPASAPRHDLVLPQVTLRLRPLAELRSLVGLYYRGITSGLPYRALVGVGMIFTVAVALDADVIYGTTTYPVTYAMIEVISSFGLFFLIITAFYSGELVWRDRSLHSDQILDATPVSSTRVFAAKILSLLLAQAVLLLALIAVGVALQAVKGYYHFELDVYFGYLFGIVFPGLILTTLLAFFLQVLVDNKYLGIALVVCSNIFLIAMGAWGLEHRLYGFGNLPNITYSAMNGYGPDLGAFAWFFAYYFAWAIVLMAIARLLLVRGTVAGLRARLRAARARLTPTWFAFAGLALAAWVGLGVFIHHNTNVLNVFRSRDASDALQAEFERDYKQHEKLPQPRIVAVEVHVDLYPERGHMRAKGSYKLVNKHAVDVAELHLRIAEPVTIHSLELDRPTTIVSDDKRLRYQIRKLATPMRPGETATLNFDVGYEREGFGNNGRSTSIVANGSFFNNAELLPGIGYNRGFELADDDRRKEQGLPLRERTLAIDDPEGLKNTYIASDADWIDFAASVCTSPDQIAIAPGYLQREWEADGRRCFAYQMDNKILPFFSFMSARYAVLRDTWKDVNIEIYYQPGHEYNLARMVDAVKKSLDYFTSNFSPYQHRQVRILEFPRYASFAQAFPNTIPFSESIGFIARVRPGDPDDLDYPFYVTAHEVAHQWWAHQVIGADVQGSTMMSESLSQYSALMVMEREYGRDKMKKFLAYELRSYLRGRSGETKKELPIALAEDQGYIHYNKGSLVFYALREYLGEDVLNAALAHYIKQVAFQPPPFTTSKDLVAILREATPPAKRHIIEDLLETITLFDNKVSDASVDEKDGKFTVKLTLAARKLRADELGVETEIPLGDDIEVGIYAAPGEGETVGKPLYLQYHHITQAETILELTVDERPARAGIDPANKLIDRNPDDNTRSL
jgi:ABC-2 type transport system permease protein